MEKADCRDLSNLAIRNNFTSRYQQTLCVSLFNNSKKWLFSAKNLKRTATAFCNPTADFRCVKIRVFNVIDAGSAGLFARCLFIQTKFAVM